MLMSVVVIDKGVYTLARSVNTEQELSRYPSTKVQSKKYQVVGVSILYILRIDFIHTYLVLSKFNILRASPLASVFTEGAHYVLFSIVDKCRLWKGTITHSVLATISPAENA